MLYSPLFAQRTYRLKYMGKTSSNRSDYQYFYYLCTPYIRNVLPKDSINDGEKVEIEF